MKQFFLPNRMNSNAVNISVVGLGGSGGEFLDGLHRLEAVLKCLGHKGFNISLFDPKKVGHQNIGRTRFSPADIGQFKTDVIATKYNLAYGLNIKSCPYAFDIQAGHLMHCDLLVTCSDSANLRCDIGLYSESIRASNDFSILWLDLGNTDYTAQFVLGMIGKDSNNNTLPNVYDLYQDALKKVSLTEDESSSCSLLEAVSHQSLFINGAVATHSLALLYELFRLGVINTHGGFIDLKTHSVKPLNIDQKIWAFLMSNINSLT